MSKGTEASELCLCLQDPGTRSSGKEVESRGLGKKVDIYEVNIWGQWVAIWPFLVIQTSNKLCASYRLPSECSTSPILHCLPFISNNRQSSTNYLVSKVFPSVLPFCNSISLMLTAEMAWCPDADSTSESGALKSVPALWKCAGRCDSDLSLAYFLEHSKALNKNNSHLWSTHFYQVLFHIFYMHNSTIFLWDIYHYHPHFIDKVVEAPGGQKTLQSHTAGKVWVRIVQM